MLKEELQGLDAFTFAPIGDAASGNVLIMKCWALLVEELQPLMDNKILLLPDTCQAHSHQRGKLGFRCLKFHAARHCSLARVLRHDDTLRTVTDSVSASIRSRVVRVVHQEPNPLHARRLGRALAFMYDLDRGLDDSAMPNESQFIKDIRSLPSVVNDDVTSEAWIHFCTTSPNGAVCCQDEEECKNKVASWCCRLFFRQSGAGAWGGEVDIHAQEFQEEFASPARARFWKSETRHVRRSKLGGLCARVGRRARREGHGASAKTSGLRRLRKGRALPSARRAFHCHADA